jgi:hypothetical protein
MDEMGEISLTCAQMMRWLTGLGTWNSFINRTSA